MTKQVGISGWNVILKNVIAKFNRNIDNVAAAISVPAAEVKRWQSGESRPTRRAVVAMRRVLAS